MRVSGKWMMVVSACGVVLGQAGPADACGALPCAVVQEVHPDDASSDVPLDAEIRVRYFGALDETSVNECGENLARVRLWPDGADSPIELEGDVTTSRPANSWLVVKPPEPLLANTAYRLELNVRRGGEACSCEGEWTALSSFTTGDDLDAEAPELGSVSTLGFGERQTGSSNCGTQDLIPLSPDLEKATDDSPGVRYNIYVDGVLVSPYTKDVAENQEGYPEIYLSCGTSALINATLVEPDSRLEIRAVDLSGNESAPADAIRVPDLCSAPEPEASGGGGCSVSAPRREAVGSWSFAFLAAAVAYATRGSKRRSLARKTSTPGDATARCETGRGWKRRN